MTPIRADEIAAYAAGVRAALADMSTAERAELLADLEDHLREVAAESDVSLRERLGTPKEYAAELRAAYGIGAGASDLGRRLRMFVPALTPVWGVIKDLFPELRVLWWALRGYLIAGLVMSASASRMKFRPVDLGDLVLPMIGMLISIYLGKHVVRAGGRWRAFAAAGNVIIVVSVIYLMLGNPYEIQRILGW
jgi:HAAS domain-containing protein